MCEHFSKIYLEKGKKCKEKININSVEYLFTFYSKMSKILKKSRRGLKHKNKKQKAIQKTPSQ